MNLRIVPYKMTSLSAKHLATSLSELVGYKVWRGGPKPGFKNISWGSRQLGPPGTVWINPPEAVAVAQDKLSTFDKLNASGVPHVPYTTAKEAAQAWLEAGKTVFARTRSGHGGRGISIVLPGNSDLPDAPLYTQYVKKRAEFRVHVVQGTVIQTQEKRRKSGVACNPMVRNHVNGWVFCTQNVGIPDKALDYAVMAVAACGLDFGAVDIIWNESRQKAYVLEVNTAPGIEGSTLNLYAEVLKNA